MKIDQFKLINIFIIIFYNLVLLIYIMKISFFKKSFENI